MRFISNVISKNIEVLKVFIIHFVMENCSGKSVATGNNIGRPIIVYDDDSGENIKPSSSSGKLTFNNITCETIFCNS